MTVEEVEARPSPNHSPSVGRVRFTSAPPEIERLFAELLRQLAE